ncbi:hypothetical protein TNIN_322631 [Trichonephila inaurata madagascariensis]|uniref:Uncharacterized protein n=1 Tax=Trichonephila inaurata madagascariensis TaxID=2747483 RepID=A0A8X6Y290_9ARAC|nr:hypothetical protein TNIN_322631 [Trichonephila inaurata madagascariensis]
MVRIFRALCLYPFRCSGHANPRVSVLEAVTRSILGFCWCTAQGSVQPPRVRCLQPSRHVEKRRRMESKSQLAHPPLKVWSGGGEQGLATAV